MRFGDLFKIFQKGSKAASGHKGKGKGSAPAFAWPPGIRIGVFGHTNTGKTVYFTVLNEECKISKKLQISVTDNATATEFLNNYRALWGLGTTSEVGTVVDFRGEKKFPESTATEKLLLFNAILDRSKKVSVVAYDYPGEAVSIAGRHDLTDKVVDFMAGCDGILFFYDPKIIGAELEAQARVASFVNILERLAPLKARLPIPIAVVVTKADVLAGFSGEEKVTLIGPDDEYIIAEDFESFLETMLENTKVAGDPSWSGSVRSVMVKLKDFLRIVIGRTLDFQFFFVSATGQTPEKIGTDIGRSLYTPPNKMQPIGVKEPFYWLLSAVMRNRSITRFRKVAKFITTICLLWIVLYSLPYLLHFGYMYSQPTKVETNILRPYNGNIGAASEAERLMIKNAYRNYAESWLVRTFFSEFEAPATRFKKYYETAHLKGATVTLDQYITQLTAMIADTTQWPTFRPSDSSLILSSEHKTLIAAIEGYHAGDTASVLYHSSGRILACWKFFLDAVSQPGSDAAWQLIHNQVGADRKFALKEMSEAEKRFGDVLLSQKAKKEQIAEEARTTAELGGWEARIAKISKNPSPDYRLDSAVAELEIIKGQLDKTANAQTIARIDAYIAEANKWNDLQSFHYRIDAAPDGSHLHVEVVDEGKTPTWAVQEQYVAGYQRGYDLKWKAGDQVYIAIDTGLACQWGKNAVDYKILDGKYSIFKMDGDVLFDNLRKTVRISFNPPLKKRIPEIK
jgi:hypothetical protein